MSTTTSSALSLFLDKLERRAKFSEEERRSILGLPFTPVQLRPNQDFIRHGQHSGHCSYVLEGAVGAFGQNRNGDRKITSIFIDGDMLDLQTVVLPEAISSYQTLAPTLILEVQHEAFRTLGHAFPRIADAFWRECVVHQGIALEWVVNVSRRDARSRMAHFYCELAYRSARNTPNDGMIIPHAITQLQLADILGMTAVHVNRTLQRLRQDGLMASVERSMQRILDWTALAAAGEFDPGYLRINQEEKAFAA